jgi:signal transduction histidine kinase
VFTSLRSRLWLSYSLLIVTALGVVALALVLYLIRNPLLSRQTMERLRAVETVVAAAQAGAGKPSPLQNASEKFGVRLIHFSSAGQVIEDTGAGQGELQLPRRRVLRNATVARDAAGRAWLYTLQQLPDGSWLMVAAPRPKVSVLAALRDELLPPFFQGGVIAVLLSLVVAYLFARWIADPLQSVIAEAGRVPAGEATAVVLRGPREVQELARAFNTMADRVQSSRRSQQDFIANVSHELKTPLTSIQGFAQAILDGTADTPDALRQSADVIYNEAGRMHRMALDLLDLARLDAGTADLSMARVNVAALLQGIGEKFMPMASGAGIELKIHAAAGLPEVIGDGDRLAQVFTNLLENALKFTPSGGTVTVRAAQDRDQLQISVADTGRGIPPEALAHIFDRFYQADASRQGGNRHGAGLGLAIVQELVEAHGGRISVRSALDRGTAFIVHLPLGGPASPGS